MTDHATLKAKIAELQEISDAFYSAACRAGVHAFIEHCGLMNEHIKVLSRLADMGVDPIEVNIHCSDLPDKMKTHEAAYLAEKFFCMFGPVLGPEAWETFKDFGDAEVLPSRGHSAAR